MECQISDQTADEAGYWDARLRSPDCTDGERARFAEWRDATPDHRVAFERLQLIHASVRNNVARADIRALRDAALTAKRQRSPRRRFFAAAAAVAGLAAVAALWTTLPNLVQRAPLNQLLTMTEALLGTQHAGVYETGTGQRSTTTLQDGSTVELNARTRIKVAFSAGTRNVELIYGQALFRVAHDERRPFIVRVADREVTAVGTQFDVRLDATSLRVTLIEGKVKVSPEPSPSSAGETAVSTSAHPAESGQSPSLYLTPGQQFIARLGSNPVQAGVSADNAHVRTIDVAKVTGWRDGRIFLEDLTLADAVAEMNRHSPVQISVTDPQVAKLRVNGMFRAGEQEAFVAALEQYFPIVAEHSGDTEILLRPRR